MANVTQNLFWTNSWFLSKFKIITSAKICSNYLFQFIRGNLDFFQKSFTTLTTNQIADRSKPQRWLCHTRKHQNQHQNRSINFLAVERQPRILIHHRQWSLDSSMTSFQRKKTSISFSFCCCCSWCRRHYQKNHSWTWTWTKAKKWSPKIVKNRW